MFSRRRHIAQTLLLLATLMVPVQQSLVAMCCCGHGQNVAQRQAAESPGRCCTQGGGPGAGHHCCSDGACDSGAKPCRCPAGTCRMATTAALNLATVGVSSLSELTDTVVPCSSAVDADFTTGQFCTADVLPPSPGGTGLCVALGRFLL